MVVQQAFDLVAVPVSSPASPAGAGEGVADRIAHTVCLLGQELADAVVVGIGNVEIASGVKLKS